MRTLLIGTILLMACGSSWAQEGVLLINGDSLQGKVKKISGTSVTIQRDGIDYEINPQFIIPKESVGNWAAGSGMFVDYSTPYDGVTKVIAHSADIEANADQTFKNAKNIL